jgi:hypothetical protein
MWGGQLLNAAIYRAIGKAGVYYGVKFGHEIPWYARPPGICVRDSSSGEALGERTFAADRCTGFPFNVFTLHPQYSGCVILWPFAV